MAYQFPARRQSRFSRSLPDRSRTGAPKINRTGRSSNRYNGGSPPSYVPRRPITRTGNQLGNANRESANALRAAPTGPNNVYRQQPVAPLAPLPGLNPGSPGQVPAPNTTGQTPGGFGAPGDIDAARAKALKDAIAAIGAQYGFNLAGLNNQMGDVSNTFRTNLYDIEQQEAQAREDAMTDAGRRGAFQSSSYAQNIADVLKGGANARAKNAQEFGTRETTGELGSRGRDIDSAIKLLIQQKQAAETEARTMSGKGALDLETLLALIGVGMSGTNFAGA